MRFRSASISTLALLMFVLVGACGKNAGESANPIPVSYVPAETATTVSMDAIVIATSACPSGYAHPSICCASGYSAPGYVPVCETYKEPFYPCGSDFMTYPSAASCCSLESPSDCITGPSDSADAESNVATCAGRCPPGITSDGAPDGECCKLDLEGNDVDCHPKPVTSPSCSYFCPAGWEESSPYGDVAICCHHNLAECFAAVLSDGSNVPQK